MHSIPQSITSVVCFHALNISGVLVFVEFAARWGAGAGVAIPIDLIDYGGEAVPSIVNEPIMVGRVCVATMMDLWRMKGRA